MLLDFLNIRHKGKYRYQGDRHRDVKDWMRASEAYRLHLQDNEADQPIWVQFGHSLKEQDLLEEAVAAYETATRMQPLDEDAQRHLADVLRRLGRDEAALAAYERLNELKPDDDARRHIRKLRRDTQLDPVVVLGRGTVFFSVQDLFGYLKAHVTMSGIQRTQAGIAAHAIEDPTIDARFTLNVLSLESVALEPGEFWMIDNERFNLIIDYASGMHVEHEVLRDMISECEELAVRVVPDEGSTVILLGAFWGLGNSVQNFIKSKRDGVRIGAYVYDIIPVTHPEFCDDMLAIDFTREICALCLIADFILTISDATRIALQDFNALNGGRKIEMATVKLAHHLTRESNVSTTWPNQLSRVKGRRFVLYVSTIEGRKNHLYVVNAWRRLIAEGLSVPDIVFVGRPGWKTSALDEVLQKTDNLNGRLHIAHNLSDGELNLLYATCEFSVFTSFVEGWGLPVGESLHQGRPCIASNTSSIPEVGGDLVDYVNPFDLNEGIGVFRRMVSDRDYLARRAEAIRTDFVSRTWSDVGRDFIDKIKTYRDLPVTPLDFTLAEGKIVSMLPRAGSTVNTRELFDDTDLLTIDQSIFFGREGHGAWLRGSSPVITIATPLTPGTKVTAYVALHASPTASGCMLRIIDLAADEEAGILSVDQLVHNRFIRMPATVGKDRSLQLRLVVRGSYTSPELSDKRDFAIGMSSIAYARPDNFVARLAIIERSMMSDLPPNY